MPGLLIANGRSSLPFMNVAFLNVSGQPTTRICTRASRGGAPLPQGRPALAVHDLGRRAAAARCAARFPSVCGRRRSAVRDADDRHGDRCPPATRFARCRRSTAAASPTAARARPSATSTRRVTRCPPNSSDRRDGRAGTLDGHDRRRRLRRRHPGGDGLGGTGRDEVAYVAWSRRPRASGQGLRRGGDATGPRRIRRHGAWHVPSCTRRPPGGPCTRAWATRRTPITSTSASDCRARDRQARPGPGSPGRF